MERLLLAGLFTGVILTSVAPVTLAELNVTPVELTNPTHITRSDR